MTVKTDEEIKQEENIIDNLPDVVVQPLPQKEITETVSLDQNKLAALKAKNQSKQSEQKSKIGMKKEKSINFGVVGSGQAGSKLSQCFFKNGYDAVAINTAIQDLKHIDIPDSNKLLLEYGVGGASKELEIGKAAAESHKDEISRFIKSRLLNSDVNILCLSLGGGSGAGSCEVLIDILSELNKPIIVMTVLPMGAEDVQTKANSLETLAKLANYAKNKKISNLIVVDNAKIESIYHNVSQMDFYNLANKVIVDTFDAFNYFSAMPSSVKPLDPMEFSKIILDGEGLTVYGELVVENYQEDTAIAEAVINNLTSNLLSEGFDLKQSKYVGVIIAANAAVWKSIPTASVNYAMSMINDFCENPKGVFKGIYTIDDNSDLVKVYSIFSGLGLPSTRVEQLKTDTQELLKNVKNKDEKRNINLNLDTGTNQTISEAQKIKDKIAAKSSTFGKFIGNTIDRRK